jgi:hypothetical protein
MDVNAYAEQLGWNRQVGGSTGEITTWYARIGMISTHISTQPTL